jgi:hypothetical protein
VDSVLQYVVQPLIADERWLARVIVLEPPNLKDVTLGVDDDLVAVSVVE